MSNGKKFHYLYSGPVRGNNMAEQKNFINVKIAVIVCKEKCCKCKGNRKIRLNEELTKFHKEVLCNLNSIHGALLHEPKYPVGRCKRHLSSDRS